MQAINRSKILIIEDNPISRKVLRLSLESENYTVVEAVNGSSGLQEAEKQNFDLIIQDLLLPDMDGYTLNQKLKEIPGVKNVPIFALSGFISRQENEKQGSGFSVFLLKPIEPSYLLDIVKAHLPAYLPLKISSSQGKHILIADDNAIQLKLSSMHLKNMGFEVTTATDGITALEKAKERPPDIIISDILMPKMDGFSLCVALKNDQKLLKIPVILLTSHYLENADLALATKVGASAYLTRTPNQDKFVSELFKILNTQSSVPQSVPFELTPEIKEEHMLRSTRQLEQQVLDNEKLSQRCALLLSQLGLISSITDALTTTNKNMDESLKDVLYLCLDATGISKGALYIKTDNNNMLLKQYIGFTAAQREKAEDFFGESTLISEIIKNNEPFLIPSKNFSNQRAQNFLDNADVKFALLVPMFSGTECLGLLFLGSDLISLSGENTKEFVRTLGVQFGQSIALTSAFDKLSSSEKRYRQLVEISPDAIFVVQDEKFVYANSAAFKLLSVNNSDTFFSHSFYHFFTPDYRKVIQEHMQQRKNKVSTSLPEGKIIDLKNDIIDVEIVVSPFLYQQRAAVYMIMRDITERKRSALHLEIQYAIAWTLAESATLFMATAKILKIICERLQWDCGAIWSVDKETNTLRCTRVWQAPEIQGDAFQKESQDLKVPFGEGILGQSWKDRKAIWISDVMHNQDFQRKTAAKEVGLNTAVAFPIVYEHEVLGVIEFCSKKILNPIQGLLLWFESIGNQFGLFLVRKHMEGQMLYQAEHDMLTGLANRRLLEQYLNSALSAAQENGQKLAILFLDLDRFKFINDSLGHEEGDALLKVISKRFQECLRPEDTLSRLGGDEFILILSNIHEKQEIIEIIARVQAALSKQINLKKKSVVITASIGISIYPDDGKSVQNLIKGADIAMYAAKEKGRNNYQFCTADMTLKAENRGILQNNLRTALENNEFLLYYQPKIDVTTRKITGMEALIRWKRSGLILLPLNFISAVEDCDLIVPIGEWVLKNACMQHKAWQNASLPPITMSINLSVRNLNEQLLLVIEKLLAETNIMPNTLEVEVTENVLMDNVENNIKILRRLKQMGLKISIDDFGTGYSSLSYLKRFPIDAIKIDQSFVRDLATDPDDAAIVTAIIGMSHDLGFKVIAEGVETLAQLKFLCENGCDEIQGFYFSRPLAVAEATDFLKNAKLDWHF